MAVTYRAATSTTVTFPSRSVSVTIRGSTFEACANAKLVPKEKHKSHSPQTVFIVHLQVLSRSSALQFSGYSRVARRGTTGPHDLRNKKPLGKSMLGPAKGSGTHPLDRRQRLIEDRY